MAAYLIKFGFTQKGVENIKESPARVEAAQQTVRKLGGEVKAFYAILGSEFDKMAIKLTKQAMTLAAATLID